jgi:hypothetical protein
MKGQRHGRQIEGKKVKLDGIIKEIGFDDMVLSYAAQERAQFQAVVNMLINFEDP